MFRQEVKDEIFCVVYRARCRRVSGVKRDSLLVADVRRRVAAKEMEWPPPSAVKGQRGASHPDGSSRRRTLCCLIVSVLQKGIRFLSPSSSLPPLPRPDRTILLVIIGFNDPTSHTYTHTQPRMANHLDSKLGESALWSSCASSCPLQ